MVPYELLAVVMLRYMGDEGAWTKDTYIIWVLL